MAKMDAVSARTLFFMVCIGLSLVALSGLFGGWHITMGVAAGVLLAVLDFWLIQRFVNNLLLGHQRGFFSSGYLIRFAAICGFMYVALYHFELNVIAIAVGFSALVIAAILSGLTKVPAASSEDDEDLGECTELEVSDG